MNCDRILHRLDDYFDGLLDHPERTEFERHIDACPDCAKVLDELRALQRAVAELPREVAPSRELFPAIRAALERSRPAPRVVWAAIAAGILLAALVLWIGLQHPGGASPGGGFAGGAGTTPRIDDATGEQLEAAEAHFVAASRELLEALERRNAELSPATRAVLDENLAIVDRAIAEVRGAIGTDPANLENGRTLRALYRQKLHFLWTASRVSS